MRSHDMNGTNRYFDCCRRRYPQWFSLLDVYCEITHTIQYSIKKDFVKDFLLFYQKELLEAHIVGFEQRGLRLLCQVLPKGCGQLIGTGGGLKAATNAFQTGNGFVHIHANEQGRDSLCIAGTASEKSHGRDGFAIQLNLDLTGANALGLIGNLFHAYSFLRASSRAQSCPS